MKVMLAQHGGQAAGLFLQRPPAVVDATALDPAKAAELRALVDAAMAAPAPAGSSGKTRDEMSYTISVEGDGHGSVLKQSDTGMSAEFRALLSWLKQHPQN
jgi:hypothetical protein